MRYLGGKSRIAKNIVAQMPSPSAVRNVYEPFCGGGAVTVALAQKYRAVQASDIQAVQFESTDSHFVNKLTKQPGGAL